MTRAHGSGEGKGGGARAGAAFLLSCLVVEGKGGGGGGFVSLVLSCRGHTVASVTNQTRAGKRKVMMTNCSSMAMKACGVVWRGVWRATARQQSEFFRSKEFPFPPVALNYQGRTWQTLNRQAHSSAFLTLRTSKQSRARKLGKKGRTHHVSSRRMHSAHMLFTK